MWRYGMVTGRSIPEVKDGFRKKYEGFKIKVKPVRPSLVLGRGFRLYEVWILWKGGRR